MKKKWIMIGSIIVLLVVGMAIGGTIFIKNFNEDKKKTLATMEEIKEQYKSFSPLVESFSEKRTQFYTATEELFYLETIDENREAINTLMSDYNNLVMEIHTSSVYLQENCKRKYASSSVNNTCNLFKQEYEAVMNYYITDIEVYNGVVTEYTNWITENELALEPLTVQTFSLYEQYIDYDEDGSYLGGK